MKISNIIKRFIENITKIFTIQNEIEELKLCNIALEDAIVIDRQIISQLIHDHNVFLNSIKSSSSTLDITTKINVDEKWKMN